MPAQKPLTATPSPTLDWSRNGIPASTDFDDIYFSVDNGLEETKTVFLQGCGLPEAWQKNPRFVIGELGFGTGLNFLAAWQLWQTTKPMNGHLHFVSIEKYPLSIKDLKQALSSWPKLKTEAERLCQRWPDRVKGVHRLHVSPNVTLTLFHMDVASALTAMNTKANAWFLDGFSPAKNPDMWSPEIMKLVARRSAPSARIGTFTVAGFVREGLTQAGFTVEKKPGFGRKRDRLEATYKGTSEKPAPSAIRPVIIGGGIAGASLAKGFLRRGIRPVIIENYQISASGNPAAIIKPRLDLLDRPESRFFLNSYLYALQTYAETDAIIALGVTEYIKPENHKRFEKLTRNKALTSEHLSHCAETKTLTYGRSLVIEPKAVLEDWKQSADIIKGTATEFNRKGDMWQALDSDGTLLAEGTHVIIAAGFGIDGLKAKDNFSLRYTRGQLTWAGAVLGVTHPITYGGYALPMNNQLLLGASNGHLSRMEGADPFALLDEADDENIENFKTATGLKAFKSSRSSRSAVRVVSKDTLPKFDEIDDNLWCLTGLGSRGFVFAPLLGETIVSDICGDPAPIDDALRARFEAREKPNLKTRPG